MNAFQVIDACSAAFFGLLGVWAMVVQRHWFLRLTVVGAFLLAVLLVPAYEIVIEFGIQIAIVSLVVHMTRDGFVWKRSFSIGTALLAMVVVAVAAAVAAKLPEFAWQKWVEMAGIGVMTASAVLLGLWIVCGRARLWKRLLFGAAGVAALMALFFVGDACRAVAYQPFNSRQMWRRWNEHFTWDYFVSQWLETKPPAILLGMSLVIVVLTLGKWSEWFMQRKASSVSRSDYTRPARIALVVMTTAIAAPLLAILHALLTPPAAPVVTLPTPNGYDDFLAAGKMAMATRPWYNNRTTPSRSEERQTHKELERFVDRIAVGLSKECRFPDPFADRASKDYQQRAWKIFDAGHAIITRLRFIERYGSASELRKEAVMYVAFFEESERGNGVFAQSNYLRGFVAQHLLGILPKLNASECRQLAQQLAELEARREPYAQKIATQRIIDQRGPWQRHFTYLLKEWSGMEQYPIPYEDLAGDAGIRLVMLNAALQAYILEHGRLPDDLEALVPEYLGAIPLDPLDPRSTSALKYIRKENSYVIYSVGFDRDDDGGTQENLSTGASGDMVVRCAPTLSAWVRLRKLAAEAFERYLAPLAPPDATPAPH